MSQSSLNENLEVAMMSATAVVLDRFALYQLPEGGSITLSMLPLLLIALRRGLKCGLMAGFMTGLLQLAFGGFFLNVFQVILDYLLAYTSIGLAGILAMPQKNRQIYLACILTTLVRLSCHTLSGVIFFADYAPKGTPVFIYALIYNASFLIPSAILGLICLTLLFQKKPHFFTP